MLSKIIRNFIAKRVAGRTDDGIMITLTDPKKVEFQGRMLEDLLMRNGIDPNAIKSEQQLKNILNQIEAFEKKNLADNISSGIRNTESAKIFEIATGKEIPKGSKIISGQAVDDMPPPGSRGGPDDIAAPVQSAEETLKNMTEAEIKAKLEKQNKSAIEKILKRKNREDVYGLEDYDTTNMSEIKKEIIRTETKLGNLNPNTPGFRERAKPLIDKITALQKKLRDDKADGGRIGLFKGAQADTKKGKAMSPGTSTTGSVRDDNPFTGGGGSENNNNPPSVLINNTPPDTTFFDKTSKSGLMSTLSPNILARLERMRRGFKPIIGEDIGLQYQNIDELNDILTNFRITQNIEDFIKEGKLTPDLKYKKEIGDDTFIEGGINKEGDANIMFKKQFDNLSDIFRFGKADGGRIGLKDGMNRRTFLKFLAGVASIPIIGKVFKPFKVGKTVTKVPIIKTDNIPGKPEWFDQLVNKVILEGDDVSKKFATGERQSIHQKTLDDGSVVRVTEDVDNGAVRVEYESEQNVFGDPVQMQYKKPKPDEGDPRPSAEFTTAESGPVGRRYGPDDYEIEVDEVGGSSISDLDSDVSKLKEYATGQKPTMKEIVQNKKRKDKAQRITDDPEAQSDAVVARQGEVSGEDYMYASGGIARMLGE